MMTYNKWLETIGETRKSVVGKHFRVKKFVTYRDAGTRIPTFCTQTTAAVGLVGELVSVGMGKTCAGLCFDDIPSQWWPFECLEPAWFAPAEEELMIGVM